ncbi:MAG: SpoIID/LytB domain-containing protein [Candidatus Atribacteria bacterium]|nr:SpoIID/LytB domain-containing protein [Candidatus Atribacteria bacterium]MCD6349588.1 SpoIID/LytB domain-containing protein [Candidatus Atribacteria bacterium]
MKQLRLLLFLLVILGFLFVLGCSFAFANEPWVRVGIGVFKELCLEASQGLKVYFTDGKSLTRDSVHLAITGKGTISIDGSPSNAFSILVVPQGGFVRVNGRPYRGRFMLYATSSGIKVVNLVNLEDYIKGTIKLEINPRWPREALLAYIIIVRTYALANLGRHRDEGFDFCASSHCLLYGGVNAESEITNLLVEESRGLVLTYQGKLAQVFFHSESGGVTESAYAVWGKHVPYLVSVVSPWEEDAPHARWKVSFSLAQLEEKLLERNLIQGKLKSLSFKLGENGRVKEVRAFTTQGVFTFTAHRFREAVGFDKLFSTFFRVSVEYRNDQSGQGVAAFIKRGESLKNSENPSKKNIEELLQKDWTLEDIIAYLRERERLRRNNISTRDNNLVKSVENSGESANQGEIWYVFEGSGYGHGVGLSQWGARGMALRGYNYSQILKHYFPGCEIRRAVFR